MCDGDTYGRHFSDLAEHFFYRLGYMRNENISKHRKASEAETS